MQTKRNEKILKTPIQQSKKYTESEVPTRQAYCVLIEFFKAMWHVIGNEFFNTINLALGQGDSMKTSRKKAH